MGSKPESSAGTGAWSGSRSVSRSRAVHTYSLDCLDSAVGVSRYRQHNQAMPCVASAAQPPECTPGDAAKLVEGTRFWQRFSWDLGMFTALHRRECPGLWPFSCSAQGLAADAA